MFWAPQGCCSWRAGGLWSANLKLLWVRRPFFRVPPAKVEPGAVVGAASMAGGDGRTREEWGEEGRGLQRVGSKTLLQC